ncbi:MAG: 30S ribosomal protein S21 [Candidatus Levybacteria bacterium RIFCSPHIGHO2_01_FULL_40_15b]|nr:MAG: 30S ribosomal protein S21 [Candidatus Levybacteria bacterium RIFCSPHIGHO2_01_FULL_40_15b]
MVFVKKSTGDSADTMIRKFSRKVMSEGIIQEMKKREFYLKPSLAKKYRKELNPKFAKINAPR